jgi:hypothetical protein
MSILMHPGADRFQYGVQVFFGAFYAIGSDRTFDNLITVQEGIVEWRLLLRCSRQSLSREAVEHRQHIVWQLLPAFSGHLVRYAVKRLRDASSNTGQGVAVSAEGNGRADHIFEVCSLQKGGDGLR